MTVIKTIRPETNKSNLKLQSINKWSYFINVKKNSGISLSKFKILIKINRLNRKQKPYIIIFITYNNSTFKFWLKNWNNKKLNNGKINKNISMFHNFIFYLKI